MPSANATPLRFVLIFCAAFLLTSMIRGALRVRAGSAQRLNPVQLVLEAALTGGVLYWMLLTWP